MSVVLIGVAPDGAGGGVLVWAKEMYRISWPISLYKVPKETSTCVFVQVLSTSAIKTVRRERKISPCECSNIYITQEDRQLLD